MHTCMTYAAHYFVVAVICTDNYLSIKKKNRFALHPAELQKYITVSQAGLLVDLILT